MLEVRILSVALRPQSRRGAALGSYSREWSSTLHEGSSPDVVFWEDSALVMRQGGSIPTSGSSVRPCGLVGRTPDSQSGDRGFEPRQGHHGAEGEAAEPPAFQAGN